MKLKVIEAELAVLEMWLEKSNEEVKYLSWRRSSRRKRRLHVNERHRKAPDVNSIARLNETQQPRIGFPGTVAPNYREAICCLVSSHGSRLLSRGEINIVGVNAEVDGIPYSDH